MILPYSKLSIPIKRPIFYKIREGLDNGDFYFYKFYNFFTKRVTGELLDYCDILPRENKRSSSQ